MVAAFESGVTVPIEGDETATPLSRSTQSLKASTSEFMTMTSPFEAFNPRLTEWAKPRLFSFRRYKNSTLDPTACEN